MTDRPDLVIDGDGHVIEVNETYERIDPLRQRTAPVAPSWGVRGLRGS
jgi:hypothetical protein